MLGHNNVYWFPNPLSSAAQLSKGTKPKKLSKNQEIISLIWVGRAQQSQKRILDLIPMMKILSDEIPQVKLSIIGSFIEDLTESDYQKKIDEAGLRNNIILVGSKSQSELVEYYKKADIAVNTSIIEGFPHTLNEESSYGLPIVMYDLPWLYIVKNNLGIKSVPQQDINQLANAIISIIKEPDLYRKMSQASIAKINELQNLNYSEFYNKIIETDLPKMYHPEPDLQSIELILKLINYYYSEGLNREKTREKVVENYYRRIAVNPGIKVLLKRLFRAIIKKIEGKKNDN
jgi:glycosyltransferase involved in cell wall biosynthesis